MQSCFLPPFISSSKVPYLFAIVYERMAANETPITAPPASL
jgi:hypothetical protein